MLHANTSVVNSTRSTRCLTGWWADERLGGKIRLSIIAAGLTSADGEDSF